MTREKITSELRSILAEQRHIKVEAAFIDPATRFDQLGFDSLSILDFMYDVETKFDQFPEMSVLVKMQTVNDLIDFLESHG